MTFYKYKGKRIRASDKTLIYRFSAGTLLFLFISVLLLLNIGQLMRTDWETFSLLDNRFSLSPYNFITIMIATGICVLVAFLYYRFCYYDLIRPTRCLIEESQRHLRLEHEDTESYVSYFTVNAIVGEPDFPSSEIFYFQQEQFTFPIDTSMNVEIVGNKKALTTVRNKKKELKDLDNHAYQAGNETSSNVVDALDSVDELEADLDQTKESMYKLSYVIRVSAPDLDELKRRCDEVKDFYDDLNVKLVRPAGDMLGLHNEFLPASKRYFSQLLASAKGQGIEDINAVIQSYNYGGGYLGYVSGNGKKHSYTLAENFSRDKSGG